MPQSKKDLAPAIETERWDLRPYVAGQTDKSIRAINNLTRICKEHLHGRYTIEVIDFATTSYHTALSAA